MGTKTTRKQISFPLDQRKAVAAAEYLMRQLPPEVNYMYLLKLVFFADRYHLRKYLRPVTTDTYFAMKNGAVASFLYDVFKGQHPEFKGIKKIGTFTLSLDKRSSMEQELSESDIEALDFAIEHFSKFSEFALADITHAYPEWRKYRRKIASGTIKREEMNYADFLLNANPQDKNLRKYHITDPFDPISDKDRKDLTEYLAEISSQLA